MQQRFSEADSRIIKLIAGSEKVKPRLKKFVQLDDSLLAAQLEYEVLFVYFVKIKQNP